MRPFAIFVDVTSCNWPIMCPEIWFSRLRSHDHPGRLFLDNFDWIGTPDNPPPPWEGIFLQLSVERGPLTTSPGVRVPNTEMYMDMHMTTFGCLGPPDNFPYSRDNCPGGGGISQRGGVRCISGCYGLSKNHDHTQGNQTDEDPLGITFVPKAQIPRKRGEDLSQKWSTASPPLLFLLCPPATACRTLLLLCWLFVLVASFFNIIKHIWSCHCTLRAWCCQIPLVFTFV